MSRFETWHSTYYPDYVDDEGEPLEDGWYYWFCEAGCLPDSDAFGPFPTRSQAHAAALGELEQDD